MADAQESPGALTRRDWLRTTAAGALTTLTTMFPEAKFTAGMEAGQIIAWARPDDHLQIAQAIQDMSKKEPPEKARKITVYALEAS